VKDASRAVGCAPTCSPRIWPRTTCEDQDEYGRRANAICAARDSKRVTLPEARANKFKTDWVSYAPPRPRCSAPGYSTTIPRELAAIIDWTPFFHSWELHGRYPKILEDAVVGEEARKLFGDAQAMLEKMITENWIEARAVIGLFPANTVDDDDIEIYGEEGETLMTWHNLRQQMAKPRVSQLVSGRLRRPKDSGVRDWIGAFVVTAGINEEAKVKAFEAQHDDYSPSCSSRSATASRSLRERLHQRVRTEFWAMRRTRRSTRAARERGISRHPARPRLSGLPGTQRERRLVHPPRRHARIGVGLTENYAMMPAASVSGFYFSHPDSRYFAVAR